MTLNEAADIARILNPTVIAKGEWPGIGQMFNVVLSDGQQTSIVLRPGEDFDKKLADTIGRFEPPPKRKEQRGP